MKKDFKVIQLLLKAFILVVITSCSDDILEERPESFLTPENAFVGMEGYDAAIAELHRLSRGLYTSELLDDNTPGYLEADKAVLSIYATGTDIAWFIIPSQLEFTDYSQINSTNRLVNAYWNILYRIVSNSNTILENSSNSDNLSETEIGYVQSNARFFRAFAYRYLVYLYGDVPILREPLSSPKFDFVRDPVSDVLTFMREDLEFASSNLPVENPGDGGLSKAAADHILTETLISLGDYEGAIMAATRVINDPQYSLMQERFGNYSSHDGDVFWDLFRHGNQNRSSGNTEGIWLWQIEFPTPNGNPAPQNRLTRSWGPFLAQLKDSEGLPAVLPTDTLGLSVCFAKPTVYLDSLIWSSDFNNDIRNSKHNMQRRFVNNNPQSSEYGQLIVPKPTDLNRNHFVYVQKAAAPEGYVQGYDNNGNLYNDIYAIRLAETYLLRAEANLANGDNVSAAADINVVRNRAEATPVAPADVTIDYILDERARELVVEEPRRLTLARLNKLAERVRLYNPISAPSIQDFNNLFPIPQDEIDANIEGGLEQNPGY